MKFSLSKGLSATRRAFTLMEVLIAITLFMLVVVMSLGFYNYAYNTFSYDLGRTLVNRDFRKFVSDMSSSVSYCSQVQVYSNFSTRTTSADVNGNITGNFVLCIFETPQSNGPNHITRLVGYYRGTDGTRNPIRSFDVSVNVDATTDPLTLIPAVSTLDTHPIKYPDCVGLNPGGMVFRNFMNNGTGVMVFAQLQNVGRALAMNKMASNTIHFTVVRRS